MLKFTNKNEFTAKISYKVTHLLINRMKPFSDVKIIRKIEIN